MLHYYYGFGQGKTSSAAGLALRAYGNGLSVLFVQFLKATPSGETVALSQLGIPVLRCQKTPKFVSQMTGEEKKTERQHAEKLLRSVFRDAAQELYDLIILDEVTDAVELGLLAEDLLASLAHQAEPSPEWILTGHTLPEWLKESADYLTEYRPIRHPYEKGIAARKGFEY